MMRNALRRIGLTEGEINVYLALLELGVCTTGKITQKSGVSGSKVYEVLDRLEKKGLASSVVKNEVKQFEAAHPERILDYIEEKEKLIEKEKTDVKKIIPELILKQKFAKKSSAKIFTGFDGIKTTNEDIIKSLDRGEEWLSMGLTEQPKAWEIYFNKRQEVRAKKGIIQKHLLNVKYKSLFERRKRLAHTEFRFLPEEFETPTSTEIYKNKVVIMILLQESPMAIMIESEAVANSFRKYFYALWRNGKRLNNVG